MELSTPKTWPSIPEHHGVLDPQPTLLHTEEKEYPGVQEEYTQSPQEQGYCQGHSAPRHLQRGLSYPRTPISPEWVVLVKLYTMKALWLYRYERGGGPDERTITNRC